MIGDIGGNEIDAVTVSIISKQKKKKQKQKKIPFYFPCKINCYDY